MGLVGFWSLCGCHFEVLAARVGVLIWVGLYRVFECLSVSLAVSLPQALSQFNSRALLAWETCVNYAKASEVDNIQK